MTPRALEACAAFGLLPRGDDGEAARRGRAARASALRIDSGLRAGGVCVVTGASGAGKSMVLRALRERLGRRGRPAVVVGPPPSGRAVIDAVPGTVGEALRALASAGLGEAPLLARRAADLSDGQRARLGLARGFVAAQRAGTGATLVVDELGSGIDAVTRESVARGLARWARRLGVRVAAATVHEGVASVMRPDLVLRLAADGSASEGAAVARRRRGVVIERGTIHDYAALAHLHYRAGRPASVVRVLRARHGGEVIGVLVVSMPTLDGWWRELAWPGRFRCGDKSRDTARLNREVRCISRVIVDPRRRGTGVARLLVRAYLRRPLTPLTESCAAMGAWCPFFSAAGMTEYRSPPSARDARLADALAGCGLGVHALLTPRDWPPLVRKEVARWALASRVTRGVRGENLRGAAAWRAICSPRVAYAGCREEA